MRFRALACDYDGTLATHGVVDHDTVAALARWLAADRLLLMVTGRELPELKSIFPELAMFHLVVAENGALLYDPARDQETPLAAAPSDAFVQELTARGVAPISRGRAIVATWEPHETVALQAIHDLQLELQVIFNKGAVMILPSGINKATGLAVALRKLELSRHNVAGIGDAENDQAFLQACRLGVATANALPTLKDRADLVTQRDHGGGVAELVDCLLSADCGERAFPWQRHRLRAPHAAERDWSWLPGCENLVVYGPNSSVADAQQAICATLASADYQYCQLRLQGAPPSVLLPPEINNMTTVVVGNEKHLPSSEEVLQTLSQPARNVDVVLTAGNDKERVQRLRELGEQLCQWQAKHGRPHVLLAPPLDDLAALQLAIGDLGCNFRSLVVCGEDLIAANALPDRKSVLSKASEWLPTSSKTAQL